MNVKPENVNTVLSLMDKGKKKNRQFVQEEIKNLGLTREDLEKKTERCMNVSDLEFRSIIFAVM